MENKICRLCGKELPGTVEYFPKMKRYLRSECRTCFNADIRERTKKDRVHRNEAAKARRLGKAKEACLFEFVKVPGTELYQLHYKQEVE